MRKRGELGHFLRMRKSDDAPDGQGFDGAAAMPADHFESV